MSTHDNRSIVERYAQALPSDFATLASQNYPLAYRTSSRNESWAARIGGSSLLATRRFGSWAPETST